MRSLFENGFRREPWAPALGAGLLDIAAAGVQAYQAYEAQKKAEAARKKAEAEAAQAKAAAQKAQEQAATQIKAIQTAPPQGIPTGLLVAGGLGLVAVAIIIVILR